MPLFYGAVLPAPGLVRDAVYGLRMAGLERASDSVRLAAVLFRLGGFRLCIGKTSWLRGWQANARFSLALAPRPGLRLAPHEIFSQLLRGPRLPKLGLGGLPRQRHSGVTRTGVCLSRTIAPSALFRGHPIFPRACT